MKKLYIFNTSLHLENYNTLVITGMFLFMLLMDYHRLGEIGAAEIKKKVVYNFYCLGIHCHAMYDSFYNWFWNKFCV